MVTKSKLYLFCFRFCFLAPFSLRCLTWAILRAWAQNHHQKVGTCPGLPLQFIYQNRGFQNDMPDPPLKVHESVGVSSIFEPKDTPFLSTPVLVERSVSTRFRNLKFFEQTQSYF